MRHMLTAAIAVACGLGLSAAAHAQGSTQCGLDRPPGPGAMQSMPVTRSAVSPAGQNLSRDIVRQAQRELRADGLYQGRIDGIIGAQTRRAVTEFQQQSGLSQTGRLDRATLSHLTGPGYGASSPPMSARQDMLPAAPGAASSSMAPPREHDRHPVTR